MLEKFADMELQYLGETIWVPETKLGRYIGSGEGTITGDAVAGTVRWSLFENERADVCDVSLVGTIETAVGADADGADSDADGAGIEFEILGHSRHDPAARTWRLSAGIRFMLADGAPPPAPWPVTGIATGLFETAHRRHRYEIFRDAG